jgi:hypothetical protein
MKAGKTLTELAQEIERRRDAKRDYVLPTDKLRMMDGNNNLRFGTHIVGVTDLAHGQIAQHIGIPKPYYDRMKKEAPALLAENVNAWFDLEPSTRMLRTLDGKARAFLSDRYRPLENEDLAEAVLPVLLELDVSIMSCDITDTKLYIKAVDRKVERSIPKGHHIGDGTHTIFKTDELCPAIVISNSEVGKGRLLVQTSLFTKACTNLAVFDDSSIKRNHVGGKHEIADGFEALLSDETRRVSDQALWMQVRDVVKGSFNEARFNALVDKVAGMTTEKIEGDPIKTVELASKRFGINEGERNSILKHLIEGGDLSRYGLFNAVTRTAEDLPDYDRATDFERMGGQIVELDRAEWRELAMAA